MVDTVIDAKGAIIRPHVHTSKATRPHRRVVSGKNYSMTLRIANGILASTSDVEARISFRPTRLGPSNHATNSCKQDLPTPLGTSNSHKSCAHNLNLSHTTTSTSKSTPHRPQATTWFLNIQILNPKSRFLNSNFHQNKNKNLPPS